MWSSEQCSDPSVFLVSSRYFDTLACSQKWEILVYFLFLSVTVRKDRFKKTTMVDIT